MKKISYLPNRPDQFFTISMPKSEWVKTTPKRYVYHLTYGGVYAENDNCAWYYKRLDIALNGFMGKAEGLAGLWAHRALLPLTSMYPLFLDYWDFLFNRLGFISHIDLFDVWEIDTWQFDAQWYMDPNMSEQGEDQWDYLFTENKVPSHALQLYTIKLDTYEFINNDDSSKYDLIPVKWINKLLNHKRNKLKYAYKSIRPASVN